MDLPTYEPAPEPDRTPRDNPIFSEPATVAACAREYADAARIRAEIDKQQKRTR
ncbi:hypothetical protein ACFQ9J_28480 [Streptomyces sp. NPDC056529]|uniref:hypothetical protein n=1 Tax=Streptomyces sp. NPDC056529 TaxID=3345855 RepID=UPI0036B96F06